MGARYTAIDISSKGIEKAILNVPSGKFYEMNAEEMTFPKNNFDLIFGTGILHHLDLLKALRSITKVLIKEGQITFIEPLGHNPFINLYRWLTPKLRSEDEHPLLDKDLKLFLNYFEVVEVSYFNLTTFFAVPFRNSIFFKPLLKALVAFDNFIFKIKPLRKFAWIVVLNCKSPKK